MKKQRPASPDTIPSVGSTSWGLQRLHCAKPRLTTPGREWKLADNHQSQSLSQFPQTWKLSSLIFYQWKMSGMMGDTSEVFHFFMFVQIKIGWKEWIFIKHVPITMCRWKVCISVYSQGQLNFLKFWVFLKIIFWVFFFQSRCWFLLNAVTWPTKTGMWFFFLIFF